MSEDDTDAEVDVAKDDAGQQRMAQRFWRPIGTQRVLQIVLGAFWILDAALQFQPFMFKRDFVETFILPNASGQPAVMSWVITNVGHFIEPHIALWNTFFAVIQLVIGVGLLFPRRSALPSQLVRLGAWRLGIRRGAGHDPHRQRNSVDRRSRIGPHLWPDRADGVAHQAH